MPTRVRRIPALGGTPRRPPAGSARNWAEPDLKRSTLALLVASAATRGLCAAFATPASDARGCWSARFVPKSPTSLTVRGLTVPHVGSFLASDDSSARSVYIRVHGCSCILAFNVV